MKEQSDIVVQANRTSIEMDIPLEQARAVCLIANLLALLLSERSDIDPRTRTVYTMSRGLESVADIVLHEICGHAQSKTYAVKRYALEVVKESLMRRDKERR